MIELILLILGLAAFGIFGMNLVKQIEPWRPERGQRVWWDGIGGLDEERKLLSRWVVIEGVTAQYAMFSLSDGSFIITSFDHLFPHEVAFDEMHPMWKGSEMLGIRGAVSAAHIMYAGIHDDGSKFRQALGNSAGSFFGGGEDV